MDFIPPGNNTNAVADPNATADGAAATAAATDDDDEDLAAFIPVIIQPEVIVAGAQKNMRGKGKVYRTIRVFSTREDALNYLGKESLEANKQRKGNQPRSATGGSKILNIHCNEHKECSKTWRLILQTGDDDVASSLQECNGDHFHPDERSVRRKVISLLCFVHYSHSNTHYFSSQLHRI